LPSDLHLDATFCTFV
jgi:hypothetical protein